MSVNWQKKKSVTLKALGIGPAYLLYLVFFEDMKLFDNGVTAGLFLCVFAMVSPAILVFLVYWPAQGSDTEAKEGKSDV